MLEAIQNPGWADAFAKLRRGSKGPGGLGGGLQKVGSPFPVYLWLPVVFIDSFKS